MAYGASGAAFTDSGSSVAIAAPAGVVADSVVVATLYLDGATDQNVTAPAGWAAAASTPVATNNHRAYIFWHRAAGPESGPYVFTWDASVFREGQAHRYDNVITTDVPFDTGVAAASENTSSSSSPAVSITTTGPDRVLVHVATCWSGGTWTPPAGFTRRQQTPVGLITLGDAAQAAAGSSGSVVATTTTSERRTAWLGALRPAGALITGVATGALGGLTGVAAGIRTVLGSVTGTLGRLIGSATGTATTNEGSRGSWYGLLAIHQEAQQLRLEGLNRRPVSCPNDGTLLTTGSDGVLRCTFDGWTEGDTPPEHTN